MLGGQVFAIDRLSDHRPHRLHLSPKAHPDTRGHKTNAHSCRPIKQRKRPTKASMLSSPFGRLGVMLGVRLQRRAHRLVCAIVDVRPSVTAPYVSRNGIRYRLHIRFHSWISRPPGFRRRTNSSRGRRIWLVVIHLVSPAPPLTGGCSSFPSLPPCSAQKALLLNVHRGSSRWLASRSVVRPLDVSLALRKDMLASVEGMHHRKPNQRPERTLARIWFLVRHCFLLRARGAHPTYSV